MEKWQNRVERFQSISTYFVSVKSDHVGLLCPVDANSIKGKARSHLPIE